MKQRGVGHGRGGYRALAAALLGCVAVAVAGCGGGGSSGGATAPADRLTVRRYDGERLVGTTALDCGLSGGACDRVAALLPRLAPDPSEACAQIYGGPERRVVEGVVDGRAVHVEVTRADGCQIARYDLLAAALG